MGWVYKCGKCGEACEVYVKMEREPEEFWGMPVWREEYYDYSECCDAEAEEVFEEDEDDDD